MADNGHYLYSLGSMSLYLPFPKPLTGSIKSAFFQFCNEIACGSNRILCDSSDVGTAKDTINAHICKYRFRLFNRALACVQPVNRNLNRNIFVLNCNLFPQRWLQAGQSRSDTADPE